MTDGQPGQDGQRAQDRQYYRRILHDLLETGARVNRMIQRQTEEGEETAPADAAPPREAPAPAPVQAPARLPVRVKDVAIAYDQVTRSMRRNIMLAETLAEPVPAASQTNRQRIAARKRIIREVEDVIQRNAEDEAVEPLRGELPERLDSPDLEDEIGDRPIAEIIADICRDLGVAHAPGTHPWKRRTPAEIAELRARAARPAGCAAQPPAPVPPAVRPGPAETAAPAPVVQPMQPSAPSPVTPVQRPLSVQCPQSEPPLSEPPLPEPPLPEPPLPDALPEHPLARRSLPPYCPPQHSPPQHSRPERPPSQDPASQHPPSRDPPSRDPPSRDPPSRDPPAQDPLPRHSSRQAAQPPRAPPSGDRPVVDHPLLHPLLIPAAGQPTTAPPGHACPACRKWRWHWRVNTRLLTTGWVCGVCHQL